MQRIATNMRTELGARADRISQMAKFDGELSSRTMNYAGTGRLRYTW
jgi:hypothetical protein